MADGIFLNGTHRPRSKKQIKELAKEDPTKVQLEVTRFGAEAVLNFEDLADRKSYYFVGPDPSRSRKFYGQLERQDDKLIVR